MSAKFPEYKGLDLPNVANEILQYWQENNIFEKSVSTREGNEPYVFYEGPPSAFRKFRVHWWNQIGFYVLLKF